MYDDEVEISMNGIPIYLRPSVWGPNSRESNNILRDEEISDDILEINRIISKKRELLNNIIKDGLYLKDATPNQKEDERINIIAFYSNVLSLQYASLVYQDREDIIFKFIETNPCIYKYASPRLRNTKSIVLEAVEINGVVLEYVNSSFRNDYDVVYKAVSSNGLALKYASYHMRSNREIIKTAIKQNGLAIRFVDPKVWKSDKELILLALKTPGARLYLNDMDDSLKNDLDFIVECCNTDKKVFNIASDSVKDTLRVQYIKNYVDALFGYAPLQPMIPTLEDNNNDIEVEYEVKDSNYDEFIDKKSEFINIINDYYMTNTGVDDDLYELLQNFINYEIELSIASCIYPFVDFNDQLMIFNNNIKKIYNFCLTIFCREKKIPLKNVKNINYDLLPDQFYNQLNNLSDNYINAADELKNKLKKKKENKTNEQVIGLFYTAVNIYQLAIKEISSDKSFYKDSVNYFELISIKFVVFYDYYCNIIKNNEISSKNINKLKDKLTEIILLSDYLKSINSTTNQSRENKQFSQNGYMSLKDCLDAKYKSLFEQYISKINSLTSGSTQDSIELRILKKKMKRVYNLYMSSKYDTNYIEGTLFELNTIDFDKSDDMIVIDNIRVGLPEPSDYEGVLYFDVIDPTKELFSSMKCFYCSLIDKRSDIDEKNIVSLRDFIKGMHYVGLWDLTNLGIRHIIYSNDKYSIVIQNDALGLEDIMIIKNSKLDKELMNYENGIEERYGSFVNKENFLNFVESLLEDSYTNYRKGLKEETLYFDQRKK